MADPEDDNEGDETVVVTGRPRRAGTVVPPEPPDDDEDEDEDRTAVVDRDEDRTVVIERDKTVVIDRRRRGSRSSPEAEAPAADSVINLLPTRRGVRVAPVEPGFGRQAVEAIGPNVVETYVPREIAPPPVAGPAVPRGEEALRAAAPTIASVERRSRTTGAVALVVFAAACVVSVVGVIVVIVWFARS